MHVLRLALMPGRTGAQRRLQEGRSLKISLKTKSVREPYTSIDLPSAVQSATLTAMCYSIHYMQRELDGKAPAVPFGS